MQSATDITASNALPARLPKGFELHGYVVDGWLRDGGMAAIYRAHRASDEQRVALKLQLPSTAHDETIGQRFDLEAELMRRVGGTTHVVELFDAGVLDDGRRYLVMEWVDGEDLEEVLDFSRNQDQRLQISRACRIGRDVARGLAELHEHGVVHLDLKPANVMIGMAEDGRDAIKLVDFGIAVDLRALAVEREPKTGAAPMGTSSYMSPEQARGEASVPAFDVYALGVLLFEILSGTRLPPDGWSSDTLPPLEELRRGVPRSLAALVRACMNVDPERRPASAEDVARGLDRISTEVETGPRTAASVEVVAVRSGGTELVLPIVETAAATPVSVRTGATEVRLTHDEVLQSSGIAPAQPPEALVSSSRPLEVQGPEYEPVRRPWVKWAVLAGAMVVAGVAWLAVGRSGGDGAEAYAGVASAADMAVEPKSAEPKPSTPQPILRGPEARTPLGNDIDANVDVVDDPLAERPAARTESEQDPVVPPAKPKKAAKEPASTKETCEAMQSQASDAKKARAWNEVLKATSKRGCWASSELRLERARLRVAAHAELREYRKCVKEGGNHRDPDIAARTSYCKKKLEDGDKGTANPWK